MTAHLVGRWPPHSPDWYAARVGRIGGSEVGSIIGHGYRTRDELMSDKRAELAGTWEPAPSTDAQQRGIRLEPALLVYAAERGHVADQQFAGTWVDDEHDWMSCNPDGVTADGVLIECKSTRTRDVTDANGRPRWGRGGTDQIPPGYLAQVTWTAGILGLDRWVLPLHATKIRPDGTSDDDWALYKGRTDLEFFAWLIGQAATFYTELMQGGPNAIH